MVASKRFEPRKEQKPPLLPHTTLVQPPSQPHSGCGRAAVQAEAELSLSQAISPIEGFVGAYTKDLIFLQKLCDMVLEIIIGGAKTSVMYRSFNGKLGGVHHEAHGAELVRRLNYRG